VGQLGSLMEEKGLTNSQLATSTSRSRAELDRTRDAAIPRRDPAMKDEYDFSNAERGKFFRRDAQLIPPVHLDPEVLSYLAARAEAHGTSLNDLVNELLKKDIERIEGAQ